MIAMSICDKCHDVDGDAHTAERCAHNRILRWVRSRPVGEGLPVMRTLSGGDVGIVNVAPFTSPTIVRASTWAGVLAKLIDTGRVL